jgi:hypothetical protein
MRVAVAAAAAADFFLICSDAFISRRSWTPASKNAAFPAGCPAFRKLGCGLPWLSIDSGGAHIARARNIRDKFR